MSDYTLGAKQRGATGGLTELDDPANFFVVEEKFTQRPYINNDVSVATTDASYTTIFAANKNWEVTGVTAATSKCTFSTRGGVTLTTGGTANSSCTILQPHQDSNQSAIKSATFATDDEPYFRAVVYTGASIANTSIMAGLLLTLANAGDFSSGNDAEAANFRYDAGSNGGRWQCFVSDNGTDTITDSGETVAVSTKYDLEIKVDADRKVDFYINGTRVAHGNALGTTHDLIPLLGVCTNTSAARTMDVVYVKVAKKTNA